MTGCYLLDTHALIFWFNKENISDGLVEFLDDQREAGTLAVSSVTFWEIALLVKKGKIELDDVEAWRIRIIENAGLQEISPTAPEMIESVCLPDHHKDPFDRLLIVQAANNNAVLVTKDENIAKYAIRTLWI